METFRSKKRMLEIHGESGAVSPSSGRDYERRRSKERRSEHSRRSDSEHRREHSHSHRSRTARSRSKSRERSKDKYREHRSRRSQSIVGKDDNRSDKERKTDPGRSRKESKPPTHSGERHGKDSAGCKDGYEKLTAEKSVGKTEETVDSNGVVEDPSKTTSNHREYENEDSMSELSGFMEEEEDIQSIIEQRRRQRRAILEKYQQQNGGAGVALTNGTSELKGDVQKRSQTSANSAEVLRFESTGFGISSSSSTASTATLSTIVTCNHSEQNATSQESAIPCDASPLFTSDAKVDVAVVSVPSGVADREPDSLSEDPTPKAVPDSPASEKRERSPDMFSEDLFSISPTFERRQNKVNGTDITVSGLTDNWDDAEGYYTYRVGEVLDGKYEILSSHGKGVFSTVVKAKNLKPSKDEPNEVAIKIIRNNETMYKAGHQELIILRKLAGQDKEDRRHCVRLLSSFEHRSHLCLVFESLSMNLREVLKKFGRNIGINLRAVEAYAKHLLIALKHLRNCGVLHCDIKPDNMLVNDAKNVLKLADFGSAMFNGENELTPYLVSRFYRAPEIMLGLPYDHALDMWSVGCSLYELYTGKILFPGRSNNEMLKLHLELKGPFPRKMLKKASFLDQHFDSDYNFCSIEEDPVTKKVVKRILSNIKPKDMASLVSSSGIADEDRKRLFAFRDLLDKIFVLDPDKRITVSQALTHPFITGKL